eukprot:SAG31_NODE_3244_length_4500_cov_2.174960_4_plen_687_part_00
MLSTGLQQPEPQSNLCRGRLANQAASLLLGNCARGGYGETTETDADGRMVIWPGLRLLDLSRSSADADIINEALAACNGSLRSLRLDEAACLQPLRRKSNILATNETRGMSCEDTKHTWSRARTQHFNNLAGSGLLLGVAQRLGTSGYRPVPIRSLPNLTELSLTEAFGFDGEVAVALGRAAPKLRRLRLSDDSIPAASWASLLSKLTHLQELRVTNSTELDDVAMAEWIGGQGIKSSPDQLVAVELSNCEGVTDEFLQSSLLNNHRRTRWPQLSALCLARCSIRRGLELLSVAAARGSLPLLASIDLEDAQTFSPTQAESSESTWVENILMGCPLLSRLDLLGCVAFSNGGIVRATKSAETGAKCRLRHLRHLSCGWLQAALLGELRRACDGQWKWLRSLVLGLGARVNDADLAGIARGAPQLVVLRLERGVFEGYGLSEVAKSCRGLEKLILARNVTPIACLDGVAELLCDPCSNFCRLEFLGLCLLPTAAAVLAGALHAGGHRLTALALIALKLASSTTNVDRPPLLMKGVIGCANLSCLRVEQCSKGLLAGNKLPTSEVPYAVVNFVIERSCLRRVSLRGFQWSSAQTRAQGVCHTIFTRVCAALPQLETFELDAWNEDSNADIKALVASRVLHGRLRWVKIHHERFAPSAVTKDPFEMARRKALKFSTSPQSQMIFTRQLL